MKFITSYFLYSDKVLFNDFNDFDECNVFECCDTLEEAVKVRNIEYPNSAVIVEVIGKEISENSAEIISQQIVKSVLSKKHLSLIKQ